MGLSGGIYDQFGPGAGKMLLAGMIPLAGSVFFLIVDTPGEIKTIIWFLGLTYLLCSFLIMNNVQLREKVFSAQDINLKNVRRIRNRNYILASFLFIICALFIFLRRVLMYAKDTINGAFQAIYDLLVRFSESITYDLWYRGIGDVQPDIPRKWDTSSTPFIVVNLLLVLVVISIVAAVIILAYTIIRKRGRRLKRDHSIRKEPEYIEESEIIRDRAKLVSRKKFRYTKKGLLNLNDSGKKIRYLYAFILERLYRINIRLKSSDTPVEIHGKLLKYADGEKLDAIGFDELTENYRKVRYGNKFIDFNNDIVGIADKYETAISLLNTENK